MAEELEVLDVSKGLDLSKVLGYTMFEETFDNYIDLDL